MPKTGTKRAGRKRKHEPEETIPLARCKTVQGSLVSALGSGLPFITVEIAKWPPSTLTRVLSFALGLIGVVLVGFFRSKNDHTRVRGMF
jgi:hypothetical protein